MASKERRAKRAAAVRGDNVSGERGTGRAPKSSGETRKQKVERLKQQYSKSKG